MIRPKKVYDINLDISESFIVYEKVDYRRSRLTDAQDGIIEQPITNAGDVRATTATTPVKQVPGVWLYVKFHNVGVRFKFCSRPSSMVRSPSALF